MKTEHEVSEILLKAYRETGHTPNLGSEGVGAFIVYLVGMEEARRETGELPLTVDDIKQVLTIVVPQSEQIGTGRPATHEAIIAHFLLQVDYDTDMYSRMGIGLHPFLTEERIGILKQLSKTITPLAEAMSEEYLGLKVS